MTIRIVAGAALATALWFAPAMAQPPVEAFGSLPFMTQPQLSPDGKHFAAIQDLEGKPAATIYTVNSADPPQVFASANWYIAFINWVKNDRLMVVTKAGSHVPLGGDPRLYTWYRALTVEVGTNNWTQLFDRQNDSVGLNTSTAAVVDTMPDDPDFVLIPLWTRPKDDRIDNDVTAGIMGGSTAEYRFSLYSVDVHTGHAHVIQDGTHYGVGWITDGAGGIIGRLDLTHTPLSEHLYLFNGGSWTKVRDFDASGDRGAGIVALDAAGTALVRWSDPGAGRRALLTIDRHSAADLGELYANPDYDVSSALLDERTGRVIGAAYVADKTEYVYFDPARQKLQADIAQAFPGMDASAVSVTRDGRAALVRTETPTQPPTYYYLDVASQRATKIVSEYPALAPSDLGMTRPVTYKARDGLTIHAYLTLPPGRNDGKNLPMVVMPHGGPDARDRWRFDWWAQFLANRGYAVLQPNYRGSFGYGRAFAEAGFGQWGLKIQDDISDGVKAMIADGTADAKRICIVGASYGGYAALAGATFTPELYACAVSFAGVSDLSRMMLLVKKDFGEHSGAASFWESRIGTDPAQLDATSPALHADRVRAPVLLLHGKLDTTVPIVQSEEERDALQRAGKQVEYIEFDTDDHYFTLAETRIRMLTEVERFLRTHIGG